MGNIFCNNLSILRQEIFLGSVLFFMTIISGSCHKANFNGRTNLGYLPPATQVGANTFGCFVNDSVFIPYTSSDLAPLGSPPILEINCFEVDSGIKISISGNYERSFTYKSVSIGSDSAVISSTGAYSFGNGNAKNTLKGDYRSGYAVNSDYTTDSANTGYLTISRLDLTARVVSGTFEFYAGNSSHDIVHITQGRFDVKF
jgi:hypothetical protein